MCTVLVVDDDPQVRDVIKCAASRQGHNVLEAQNPEEAVSVALESNPDVISLDLLLAESDGFSVLRRLREAGIQGFAVVVSGNRNGRTQDFSEWKKLRIFDVVDKPFHIDLLMNKLEAAADATRNEGRLCRFLDTIISHNESSLSASLSGGNGNGR